MLDVDAPVDVIVAFGVGDASVVSDVVLLAEIDADCSVEVVVVVGDADAVVGGVEVVFAVDDVGVVVSGLLTVVACINPLSHTSRRWITPITKIVTEVAISTTIV